MVGKEFGVGDPVALYLDTENSQSSDPLTRYMEFSTETGQTDEPAVFQTRIQELEHKRNELLFKRIREFAEHDLERPLTKEERALLQTITVNGHQIKLAPPQERLLRKMGGWSCVDDIIERATGSARTQLSEYEGEIEQIQSEKRQKEKIRKIRDVTASLQFSYPETRPAKTKTRFRLFSEGDAEFLLDNGPLESKMQLYGKSDNLFELPATSSKKLSSELGESEVAALDGIRKRLTNTARLASVEFKKYHEKVSTPEGKAKFEAYRGSITEASKLASQLGGSDVHAPEEVSGILLEHIQFYTKALKASASLVNTPGRLEDIRRGLTPIVDNARLSHSAAEQLRDRLSGSYEAAMSLLRERLIIDDFMMSASNAKSTMDNIKRDFRLLESRRQPESTLVEAQLAVLEEGVSKYHGQLVGFVDSAELDAALAPIQDFAKFLSETRDYNQEYAKRIAAIRKNIERDLSDGMIMDSLERRGGQLSEVAGQFDSKVPNTYQSSAETLRAKEGEIAGVARIIDSLQELSGSLGSLYTSQGAQAGEVGRKIVQKYIQMTDDTFDDTEFSRIQELLGGVIDTLDNEVWANLKVTFSLSEEERVLNFANAAARDLAQPFIQVLGEKKSSMQDEAQTLRGRLKTELTRYADALNEEIDTRMNTNYQEHLGGERMEETGVVYDDGILVTAFKLANQAAERSIEIGNDELSEFVSNTLATRGAADGEYKTKAEKALKDAKTTFLLPILRDFKTKVESFSSVLDSYRHAVDEMHKAKEDPELVSLYSELSDQFGELLPVTPESAIGFVQAQAATIAPLENAFGNESRGMLTVALWRKLKPQDGPDYLPRIRACVSRLRGPQVHDFNYVLDSVRKEFSMDGEMNREVEDTLAFSIPRIAVLERETLPAYIDVAANILGKLSKRRQEVGESYIATREFIQSESGYSPQSIEDDTVERSVSVLVGLGVLERVKGRTMKKALMSQLPKGSIDLPAVSEGYRFTEEYVQLGEEMSGPVSDLSKTVESLVRCVKDTRGFGTTPAEYQKLLDSCISRYV